MNLSTPNSIYFFLFFFFLPYVTLAISEPVDNIVLNCGAWGNSAALDGRDWTGDEGSKFSPIGGNKSVAVKAVSQDSSVDQVPYTTARISKSQFLYTFPVSGGQKFIRLHFYPASYPGLDRSKSLFSVQVGPYTLLNNFSASLYADSWLDRKCFTREFLVNVQEIERLNITFSPSNDSYAFVNGIEVVSMPTNLYYTPPEQIEGIPFVGQTSRFYVQNDTALETIYRLNVGGKSIAAVDDTGMYRTWSDDLYFLLPPKGVVPSNVNMSPKYSSELAAYAAPDNVYQTARSMGGNKTRNLKSNLTWQLPVDSGFRYLVRLHFCQILSVYQSVGDMRFIIYLDNKTTPGEAFDVIESSGGNGIPVYKDYSLMIGDHTEQYYIFIALHPLEKYTAYSDVILNGVELFKLSNPDGNLAGPNHELELEEIVPPSASINKTKQIWFIAGVCGVSFLIIVGTLLCFIVIIWRRRYNGSFYAPSWCWWLDRSYKGTSSRTKASSSLPDERCRHFSLAEIKAATNNFHDGLVIGLGGFGKVYKGYIDDGKTVVAIKRLSQKSKQGAKEFKREIEMLSQLRHVHLVSLIGYCDEEREMVLVYEYMTKGTLSEHLYDTNNDPLPWKIRLRICKGAATGLSYLHTGLQHTIIHRDVKTTNILLDEKWNARVSDFGLSIMDPKTTALNTVVKGTRGYLDPEYARGHPLTEKSDVYSFGVVLLEVLCARKALDMTRGEDQMSLALWARYCIENGTFTQIIDPFLMRKISPECYKVFVGIAVGCMHDDGTKRPTMSDVMDTLGHALELQETADAEQDKITPGGEYTYPDPADILLPSSRHNYIDRYDLALSNTSGKSYLGSGSTTFSNTDTISTYSNNSMVR